MYERFRKLLDERGMTVYQVSQITGIPQTTLSDWKMRSENDGKANLGVENLRKLSEKLNVPVGYFFGED